MADSSGKQVEGWVSDDDFGDDFVTIFVGAKRKKITIHEKLLTSKSEYFQKICSEMKDKVGEEKDTIYLKDEDPAAFELLRTWLYRGKIRTIEVTAAADAVAPIASATPVRPPWPSAATSGPFATHLFSPRVKTEVVSTPTKAASAISAAANTPVVPPFKFRTDYATPFAVTPNMKFPEDLTKRQMLLPLPQNSNVDKYTPTLETPSTLDMADGTPVANIQYANICANPKYVQWSPEEIRIADYMNKRRYGPWKPDSGFFAPVGGFDAKVSALPNVSSSDSQDGPRNPPSKPVNIALGSSTGQVVRIQSTVGVGKSSGASGVFGKTDGNTQTIGNVPEDRIFGAPSINATVATPSSAFGVSGSNTPLSTFGASKTVELAASLMPLFGKPIVSSQASPTFGNPFFKMHLNGTPATLSGSSLFDKPAITNTTGSSPFGNLSTSGSLFASAKDTINKPSPFRSAAESPQPSLSTTLFASPTINNTASTALTAESVQSSDSSKKTSPTTATLPDTAPPSLETKNEAHQLALLNLLLFAEQTKWTTLFNAAMDSYFQGEKLLKRKMLIEHMSLIYARTTTSYPVSGLRRLVTKNLTGGPSTQNECREYMRLMTERGEFMMDFMRGHMNMARGMKMWYETTWCKPEGYYMKL